MDHFSFDHINANLKQYFVKELIELLILKRVIAIRALSMTRKC